MSALHNTRQTTVAGAARFQRAGFPDALTERLEQILQCPVTGDPLFRMTPAEIATLNARIGTRDLFHRDGTPVTRKIESAFASADGQFAYPVCDGIVILLEGLAISLQGELADNTHFGEEKQNVQEFYDRIGWSRGENNAFIDADKYEDLRPVASEYVSRCRLRINRHLSHGGEYLLDVASGPIQFPEYLTYSEKFHFRICVDLSFTALVEARKKLGDRGIYLLADITNLPLRTGSVDAAISLHTIYHVPEREQPLAFCELHRVIKPDSTAVVIYSWGARSILMNTLLFPLVLLRAARRVGRRAFAVMGRASASKLYAHMHSPEWFERYAWGFELELLGWRLLSHHCSKVYAHRFLLGRRLLKAALWCEDRFPRFAGRVGQYPLVVIRKRSA